MKKSKTRTRGVVSAAACLAIGWILLTPGNRCLADAPPDLPPALQEVVKLAQNHLSDDNILAYIKQRGEAFTLTADQIIYLNTQGVSQPVITALQTKSAGTAAMPATDNPPPPGPKDYIPAPVTASTTVPTGAPAGERAPDADEVNFTYFQSELGPFGEWVDISTNGSCWVPTEIKVKPDWRPYVDQGKWTYTDKGWSWTSEYPWGEIVFHYGQWFEHPTYRWAWKPGFEWAPAWVAWRKDDPSKIVVVPLAPAAAPPPPEAAPTVKQMEQFTHQPIPPSPVPADTLRESGAQKITFQYFHDQLAPFGKWVEVPEIGACWYPERVISANPDWRPYYDNGQWKETDENGLSWTSEYTWGDIPFHYGRWIQDPRYKWLWVPGYNWGPAWVAWRDADADGCIGWAPLPYGAVWIDGGWHFHGHAVVDVGLDFGLGADFFVFVGYDHFHERFWQRMPGHNYRGVIPREQMHAFYGRSKMRNEFKPGKYGRPVNNGIGRERMANVTRGRVQKEHPEVRNAVGNKDKLATQREKDMRQKEPKSVNPKPVSSTYVPPPPRNSSGATNRGTTKSSGGTSGGTTKSGGGGTSKDTKKSP